MKLITLSIIDGNWWATFTGEEEESIRNMLGTNQIITPFNEKASALMVETHLRKQNPGYEVRVQEQTTKVK